MTTTEEYSGGAEEEVVEEPDYSTIEKSVFDFLSQVSVETKVEVTGEFNYMRPMRAVIEFLDNPHGSVKLYQGVQHASAICEKTYVLCMLLVRMKLNFFVFR